MNRALLSLLSFVAFSVSACGSASPPPTTASPATSSSTTSVAPTNTAGNTGKSGPCAELDVAACTTKCDAGDARSCLTLASAYDKVMPTAVPKDPTKTRAVLEKSCAADSGAACNWLANLYSEGRGGPKDGVKAEALLKKAIPLEAKACEAGDATSCSDLANAYSLGTAVPKDRARSEDLEKRVVKLRLQECESGNANACTSYGILSSDDDPKSAIRYMERGCDGGDPFGCDNLGVEYTTGEHIGKDADKAHAYRQRACKGGLTESCKK